jgi:hypothetical protein
MTSEHFGIGTARLISRPNDEQELTYLRQFDACGALGQALVDYFQTMDLAWWDGRQVSFHNVFSTWAEPEEPAVYPSLCVLRAGAAIYDADRFTPQTKRVKGGDIRLACELVQDFELHVWGENPEQLCSLVAGVEDMCEPVDFMTGFRLELPYYFSARATFEKLDVTYVEDPGDAQRGVRKAIIQLSGSVTQIVPLRRLPYMDPRVKVEVKQP